jgi:hypothetical protein
MTGPGRWSRSSIERLEERVAYTSNHTLYARPAVNASNASASPSPSWEGFTFAPPPPGSAGAAAMTPVATVLRNPAVQGWDYIKVRALVADGDDGFFAAGYAEGYLTFRPIYDYWYNLVRAQDAMVRSPKAAAAGPLNETAFAAFITAHVAWERGHERATPFGRQLHNQVRQMEGLVAGWRAGFEAAGRPADMGGAELDYLSIFLVNYQPEISDVIDKFDARKTPPAHPGRCSAIVKLLPDDLLVSHATWYQYNSMIRQYKTYEFVGLPRVRSSAYPGMIGSTDDWFLTDHGLAIMETTLDFSNATARRELSPASVSLFQRSSIANYLAATPAAWAAVLGTENSGTCPNQWMVVQLQWAFEDLAASRALRPGTFVVAEQAPGLTVALDQTAHLQREGYWASYNVPAYPETRRRLNVTDGPWNDTSSTEAPRARIFRAMQGDVTNATSLYYLMRYNNYEHDPLATAPWCKTPWTPRGTQNCTATQNPAYAIASRMDLAVSPDSPTATSPPSLYGAIDAKVTSARMAMGGGRNFTTIAVMGPTAVQQPPFDVDLFLQGNPAHLQFPCRGMPPRFDFAPVVFSDGDPLVPIPPTLSDGSHGLHRGIGVGLGLTSALIVLSAIIVAARSARDANSPFEPQGAADESTPLHAL